MSDPSASRPSVGVLVALVLGLLGILSLLMQNVQLRREIGKPPEVRESVSETKPAINGVAKVCSHHDGQAAYLALDVSHERL